MSLSLGALFGLGAAAGGVSSAMNLGNQFLGSWATNSARESLNKNITETNYKIQKKYDQWTIEQDKAYEQWWQNYLYNLQNNQYYDLSKKYAQNTASWAVQGLKKAGLNPVLAGIDSNLSSSMGNAQPSSSGRHSKGSVSSGSAPSAGSPGNVNLANSLQAFSAADQARANTELAETQSDVAKATRDAQIQNALNTTDLSSAQVQNTLATGAQIYANTARISAEADLLRAQAAKTSVDAANTAKNSGLGGAAGLLARISTEIAGDGDVNKRLAEFAMRPFGFTGESQHSAKSPLVHVKKRDQQPWYYDLVDKFRYNYSTWDQREPKVRHVRPLPPPGKKR